MFHRCQEKSGKGLACQRQSYERLLAFGQSRANQAGQIYNLRVPSHKDHRVRFESQHGDVENLERTQLDHPS